MTLLWPQGEAIAVETDGLGRPLRFVWQQRPHGVVRIIQHWQVDLEWWRAEGRIWRTYTAVITSDGLLCVIYLDHLTTPGVWCACMTDPPYAELHCHSYYSLLDASSAPETLVARAHAVGLNALALTDHDSLAGAVRAWTAAKRAGLHLILGAEVTLQNGHHLTLLAETQAGYANLCKLITASRLAQMPADEDAWQGKVEPALGLGYLGRTP